jgi:hypothetical protein
MGSGIESELLIHLKRCYREESNENGVLDLVGAKCLIMRLTGKEISRREIYETHMLTSGSVAGSENEYGISLSEFELLFAKIREKHYIGESTLVNNLYGALDEGRRGFTDEGKLVKCLMKANCPTFAAANANELFSRVDELGISKCSITQVHSLLRTGAN